MKNKERDGEIFMFGVLVEKAYKRGTDADRSTIKRWAAEHLTELRHRQLVATGLVRLDRKRAALLQETPLFPATE
ncbi:hypothetical protein AGMMS49959_04480 [Planctomycetales bacterium]|nr:hypothetical protein AGMMS49959_04480 [Planctomycetales bacterium]